MNYTLVLIPSLSRYYLCTHSFLFRRYLVTIYRCFVTRSHYLSLLRYTLVTLFRCRYVIYLSFFAYPIFVIPFLLGRSLRFIFDVLFSLETPLRRRVSATFRGKVVPVSAVAPPSLFVSTLTVIVCLAAVSHALPLDVLCTKVGFLNGAYTPVGCTPTASVLNAGR